MPRNMPRDTMTETTRTSVDAERKDHAPIDPEAFFTTLLQRMADISGKWRRCPLHGCRRARRCVAADVACRPEPSREFSSEESAAAMAELRAGLNERMAELDRRGDERQ